jgi:type III secretory pathway component EscT
VTTAALLVPPFLAALRLLPVTLTSPFLGGPLVPAPVRVLLAGALGAIALPAGAPAVPAEPLPLVAAGARELALGALLSLAALVPLEIARAGGRLADTFRGATLAELHVAPVRQRESALGDLLAQWCLVLAAWTGGDRAIVAGLLGTFAALPPGAPFPAALLGEGGLRLLAELSGSALAIAAPAAAGILAADLAVALVERLGPSAGVGAAAPPLRATLGLAAVALASAAIGGRLAAGVAFAGRLPGALLPGGAP